MTVRISATVLRKALRIMGKVAGIVAALMICMLIAGASGQARADASPGSDSNQSNERAVSGNSPDTNSTSPASHGKDESIEESAVPRQSRESEDESESLSPEGDDSPALSVDAEHVPAVVETRSTKWTTGTSRSRSRPVEEESADTDSTPDNPAGAEESAVSPGNPTSPTLSDNAPVVAVTATQPSFFTRIQRMFFNKTPTVSFDPDSLTPRADGTITGTVLGSDPDGDALVYTAGRPTNGGTVTIGTDGRFVYTPGARFAYDGTDLFTVTVSDDADVDGWHVHGFLGFLIAGYGSTATTNVGIGSSSTTAGGRWGWRSPRETRFTSLAALSGTGWSIYDSAGHNGWGRRTPQAVSFVDGNMVITGDAEGNTAGMAWSGGQKYGAWEVRMRVPEGAADYHALALLWPDTENWPTGGEIDFVEILGDGNRQRVSHFLHYSARNLQEAAATAVDATRWHNYAVGWTPQAITIYIDGAPAYRSADTSHFPPGPMHLALQLDASEKRPPNLSGGAQMVVAWARQYTLSQIS